MEPYADLLQHDASTMPHGDPKMEEKVMKEVEKAKKAAEVAAKKVKPAPAPKVEPKRAAPKIERDAEAISKKRELKVHKIRLYFSKLGHKLTIKEPKVYPRTDEGLAELLDAIETELHSSGGIEKAGAGYVAAVGGIEQIMPHFNPLGWQLSGPAASLSQTIVSNREQWEELVTEFAISNAEWFMVGPGKRLVATTIQLVMAVDQANKIALAQHRTPAQEVLEKAEDL